MKPPAPHSKPHAPVAIHCRCGNQIVLEPRWIGRPAACAQCEAHFIVSMVTDVRTGQRIPHVRYTPPVDEPAPAAPAARPRTLPRKQNEAPPPRPPAAAPRPLQRPAVPRAPAPNALPPAPDQMHLICTCGEELIVPSRYYNRNMYCASCGALMHLRLVFEPQRGAYELITRILDGHPPEKAP